ncbi:TPA: hypothetical protein QDZ84_003938 [Shewanella algae]|jgi:hypothetical protein|uniref:hypothetical protein n=1 Tax=Shewanella algae TaxID=38313 RepID=UPI001C5605B1|nr:hypothetical protein [Shewanella algae]HDS1208886.1 hypothetical protein [Shewanella algae]
MSISTLQVKNIFAQHGASISEKDLEETTAQCNEQHLQFYPRYDGTGYNCRTAKEYAEMWAIEAANEQGADILAMGKYEHDAYGFDS